MEPNQAEQLRGTLGAVFDDDSPPSGSQRVSENTPLAGMFSDLLLRDSVPLSTSDPDYVTYYYANRTLNPRLPPPTTSQNITRPLQWNGANASIPYCREEDVGKPAEPAVGSLLFSGLRESDLSHLNSLRTASARQPSSWANEAQGLDALLHAFSPAKGKGAGSYFSNPCEEDSTAAYNEEALFGVGSVSQTPSRPNGSLGASPLLGMGFDSAPGQVSSLRANSATASLASQDPKMVLRRKQELLQSKLCVASMPTPSDSSISLDGSGSSPSDAQASALDEALRSMSVMTPEQQAAAAMAAGMQTPEGMAELISNQQAMYMASMYPFFAQQQAMQFPFMGMPGMMPPGMGFPGMPGMMPGMIPGFPGAFPGAFPGMPGFPGMMGTPEMAAYYQKMMEAQASAMAAVGAGASQSVQAAADAQDSMIDLEGPKRRDHAGHENHSMVAGDASPARRRDLSGDMPRTGGRDSPVRREAGRSADGMGKKSGRREEEKRPDPILEEFKNNKAKKFEFPDIYGHVYEFSMDQHGSRFIQQKLETVGLDELTVALDEVLPRILNLVTDVFGNYVVQKFLDHGKLDHRLKIAGMLQGNVLSMSLQMYGCRVVQKALEVLPSEVQCEIMGELDGQVMRCVRDQNGNHVIQKIIECIPTPRIVHLLDSFLTCVVALSSHPFGCRVIQRILEYCQDQQRRGVVMDEILRASCSLAQDQYGNYVIQHVLEHGTAAERLQIVTNLAPQIVAMSMHKFASNVVEKCLIFCSVAERDILIRSMLALPSSSSEAGLGGGEGEEEDPLQQMMKDQFGNYVVQKVLELCDDVQREMMLSRVRLQLHALKKYTYGKHIVARVEKLLVSGTKMQSSNKHISQPPLPDDSELPVLQQILAMQQQKKQNDAAVTKPGSPGKEGQTR